MSALNYTITSVEPWDRRPIHPSYAKARGLEEPFDDVFILQGYTTGGAVLSPLQYIDPVTKVTRYFRPFTIHRPYNAANVTVTHADKTTTNLANVIRINKVRGKNGDFESGTVKFAINGGKDVTLKNVASWTADNGASASIPAGSNFISWKAVEFTPKEIATYLKVKAQNEYQIPAGSKKPTQ
jgi:hypothetical protein